MSQPIRYTGEVGRKFFADGAPRMFPGTTIICFVSPDSPIGVAGHALQHRLRKRFGPKFAMLPPDSFHMTVMDLLCGDIRTPEHWSSRLDLDAPLADTDGFFMAQVRQVAAPNGATMRYNGIVPSSNVMFGLTGIDDSTSTALRAYRDAIAEATGVRHPNHNTYGFHMSLAYRIIELDPDEETALAELYRDWEAEMAHQTLTVTLGTPELCFFDDMVAFIPAADRDSLRSRGPR